MRQADGILRALLGVVLSVMGLCCLTAPVVTAQTGGTATLSGIVTDASGAFMPGVEIGVKNLGTGLTQGVTSDTQGRFTVPNLQIGDYQVKAQLVGFQTAIVGPLTLSVGKDMVIDLVMQVGEMAQQVEVTANAVTIEASDNSLGGLVDQKQMQDIPLNGRNYTQLTLLTPGVQLMTASYAGGANSYVGFGEGQPQRISVSGARPTGQLYLVDGTDTAGIWGNSTGSNVEGC